MIDSSCIDYLVTDDYAYSSSNSTKTGKVTILLCQNNIAQKTFVKVILTLSKSWRLWKHASVLSKHPDLYNTFYITFLLSCGKELCWFFQLGKCPLSLKKSSSVTAKVFFLTKALEQAHVKYGICIFPKKTPILMDFPKQPVIAARWKRLLAYEYPCTQKWAYSINSSWSDASIYK